MITYHYHAQAQLPSGAIAHFDGVYQTDKKVVTWEDYMAFKQALLDHAPNVRSPQFVSHRASVMALSPSEIVITSLTLLEEQNEVTLTVTGADLPEHVEGVRERTGGVFLPR